MVKENWFAKISVFWGEFKVNIFHPKEVSVGYETVSKHWDYVSQYWEYYDENFVIIDNIRQKIGDESNWFYVKEIPEGDNNYHIEDLRSGKRSIIYPVIEDVPKQYSISKTLHEECEFLFDKISAHAHFKCKCCGEILKIALNSNLLFEKGMKYAQKCSKDENKK